MGQIIGGADEFYRLRIVTVDASDAPDLEWREDILWRRPAADGVAETVLKRLEAVDIADGETSWTLGDFLTSGEAHEAMREVDLDLHGMTKSEFEDAHLHHDKPRSPSSLPPAWLHSESTD